MTRKLGKNQVGVLGSLLKNGGFPGGWVWDTPGNTIKILDTLVKRGLVHYVEHHRRYKINDKGVRAWVEAGNSPVNSHYSYRASAKLRELYPTEWAAFDAKRAKEAKRKQEIANWQRHKGELLELQKKAEQNVLAAVRADKGIAEARSELLKLDRMLAQWQLEKPE